MRKLLYIFSLCLLVTTCNDGDVFEVVLDFEDDLTLCSEVSEDYLLYKIKNTPYESLSLIFPATSANDLIFNPTESPYTDQLVINATTIRFNYRTYNGNPEDLICALIPDPSVNITNDYEAASGAIAEFVTTFVDQDDDGIPTEIEDLNTDGDNDPSTNPTDSDTDGIPDYLDVDDDNDNVLTKNENPDVNDDGDFSDALNTDGDDLPNYLDDDDDGDGVPTRLEDEDMSNSPTNDFDEGSQTPNVARYLDATAVESYAVSGFLQNSYDRIITVSFTILNANLEILNTDSINFGTYTSTIINYFED
ncbi:hypothetical protein A9Q87_11395 [Flavobacteriales bacterium 34_180_T64]|nr:hypothetical protein A9Q87_11395 [Flavobacteriales bacterium 34_180_T64]